MKIVATFKNTALNLFAKNSLFLGQILKMKRKHIFLSAVLFPAVMAFAQQNGGMWIPTELNEKEMKDLFY